MAMNDWNSNEMHILNRFDDTNTKKAIRLIACAVVFNVIPYTISHFKNSIIQLNEPKC